MPPLRTELPLPDPRASGHDNLRLLIQLRWIAVVGQIATILVVHVGMGIRLPLGALATLIGLLIAFNLASIVRHRQPAAVASGTLFVALLVDVLILTLQLHFSGGAINPFVFLYLLQLSLAAALLGPRHTWVLSGLTIACFIGLTIGPQPLVLPLSLAPPDLGNAYVAGLLICFVLNAVLLVSYVERVSRNQRARDALLAESRQREAEAEHLLRMGLLASGAAHELGTPLATLAVILGDWPRMPAVAANPDLLADIDEMQAQVARCKTIVSGILMSAGAARAEAPARTTLQAFLAEVVAQWRSTRPVRDLEVSDRTGAALAIVSDDMLRQTLHNLLDNALEASPDWVGLQARRNGEQIEITVRDRGPGFPPAMLAALGTPYRSSKPRPGSGLGLFLAVNVARTLGGSVTAANAPGGGAVVTLALPLAAIMLAADPTEGLAAHDDGKR